MENIENIKRNLGIKLATHTRREKIIVDEFVSVKWHPINKAWYTKLGYIFTKMGDEVQIAIPHLPPSSPARVTVECPLCTCTYTVPWWSINRREHTLCRGCFNRPDIKGMVFGRLTVISPDHAHGTKTTGKWICKCACGETRSVVGNALISGMVVSCSCHRTELATNRRGAKSPKWKGGEVEVRCENCGESYSVIASRKSKTRFCSRKCQGEWASKNRVRNVLYNYNPNLTDDERYDKRIYPGCQVWRRKVFARDNYTCQACNTHGGDLRAHHLRSYHHHPKLRTDVDNGVTLCKTCHDEFHFQYMGSTFTLCTADDYNNWIKTRTLD